jgi:UDP-glucose 4-epimerase
MPKAGKVKDVILVTGAAGFIGSHTAELLLEAGHRVVGVDNFRTGRRENLRAALARPEFIFHEADVAEPDVLARIAAECAPAAVIHLAALVSVQESVADPQLNFRLNVGATQCVAEAARRHRIPRIVFASSAAVYGEGAAAPLREQDLRRCPVSPYGAAKLASENILLGHAAAYGIVVRCQRFFNVYGPRQDPASPYSGVISLFARDFREGRQVTVYGDGRQTRDFVFVRDVARATMLAATRPALSSGVVNICTGRAISVNRLARILGARYAGARPPRHAPARPGDIRRSVGDPSRARAQLGFKAEWAIEDGLDEVIDFAAP